MYISSKVPSGSSTTVVHSWCQVWRIAPDSVVQLIEWHRLHQLYTATGVIPAAEIFEAGAVIHHAVAVAYTVHGHRHRAFMVRHIQVLTVRLRVLTHYQLADGVQFRVSLPLQFHRRCCIYPHTAISCAEHHLEAANDGAVKIPSGYHHASR